MECKNIRFSRHAIERMFARGISELDVLNALRHGQLVEEYPDDKPYPSMLLLGWRDNQPIHIVAARDNENNTCIVITAYRPDSAHWGKDFKTRK